MLPLSYDAKDSFIYKQTVLRGIMLPGELDFTLSQKDELSLFDTPAGQTEVLYLSERKDFEHCVRALAYNCEPRAIPESMGAITVRGLINWEKIRSHKNLYDISGGANWHQEFKKFTAVKKNYLDSLIIIGSGNYSAVKPQKIGYAQEEWLSLSRIIRTYHELTHFVCRTLYPADIDVIRDEVLADMIGLTAALGAYDSELAEYFLGVEGNVYRVGGRLENYLSGNLPNDDDIRRIKRLIARLKEIGGPGEGESVLEFLIHIFQQVKKYY